MRPETQRKWTELVVRALDQAFPDPRYKNWHMCDRLAKQVTYSATNCNKLRLVASDVRCFGRCARYYVSVGELVEAQDLHEYAMLNYDRADRKDKTSYLAALAGIANIRTALGRFDEARSLYEEFFHSWDSGCSSHDNTYAMALVGFADLNAATGRPEEAESMLRHALEIWDRGCADHTETALKLATLLNLMNRGSDLQTLLHSLVRTDERNGE